MVEENFFMDDMSEDDLAFDGIDYFLAIAEEFNFSEFADGENSIEDEEGREVLFSLKGGKLDGELKFLMKNSNFTECSLQYKAGILDGIMKTFYEEDRIHEELPFENGKREGRYVEYYENGEIKEEGFYKDDRTNGLVRLFYKSGELKIRVPFANDKLNGNYESFYENGTLWEERVYVDDKIEGVEKHYYESGKLEREAFYKDNLKEGVEKSYYESGKLQAETPYISGSRQGVEKEYFESGGVKEEVLYKDDMKNGIYREYYESGVIRAEMLFKNDKCEGLERWFYESGALQFKAPCEDGFKSGLAYEYYESGAVKAELSFANDLRNGKSTYFYESGNVEQEALCKEDILLECKKFYDDAGLNLMATFSLGDRTSAGKDMIIEYYENGNIKSRIVKQGEPNDLEMCESIDSFQALEDILDTPCEKEEFSESGKIVKKSNTNFAGELMRVMNEDLERIIVNKVMLALLFEEEKRFDLSSGRSTDEHSANGACNCGRDHH